MALDRTGTLPEEVLMPTSLGNNKHADQDRQELRMIWLFAITTALMLAAAGFVGIVF